MSKVRARDMAPAGRNWRSASNYKALLHADRRGFAWEWLRRHEPYRLAWVSRARPPTEFGLLAYEDPDHALPGARPIWSLSTDPSVLSSRPVSSVSQAKADLFDIRTLAKFVSVEIDDRDVEHWLLTDGLWVVRLDLHDGTLLGGPALLEYDIRGFLGAEPKLLTLRQLGVLADRGQIPAALRPREARAVRWILELRTADAIAHRVTYQEMARVFFGSSVPTERWRTDNSSYRLRIQRLVRAAKRKLDDPFSGPWFD